MQELSSYVLGTWKTGSGEGAVLFNPTSEEPLARASTGGLDLDAVLAHAREVGGSALRALDFGARAKLLAALSAAIHAQREELIEISIQNAGTTRSDAKFDIDGATGTLSAYAEFGAQLAGRRLLADGEGAQLGRTSRFFGQHVLVPRPGVAVHVNAFNFPAWNMLEKAACALLAGMPVVEKPGTPTALLAWRIAQIVVTSGILPEGAWQLLCGSAGDLLDHLGPHDALAFTGSSSTAARLRGHGNLVRHNVRINVEADSLNAAVLGPDVQPESETFALFLKNVVLDMTQKSGQKCTAVRRVLIPAALLDTVRTELVAALSAVVVGDPADERTRMGPLVNAAQQRDVRSGIARLAEAGELACGGAQRVRDKGYFVAPTLIVARDALASVVHAEEVFGPVATLLPYGGSGAEAAAIVARGGGGLVASAYSDDLAWLTEAALGLAPWHGRVWLGSERMAEQSLPPGMVLPAMIHGGPGRAGGGEELGALRGLSFYLQRVALQGFQPVVRAIAGG